LAALAAARSDDAAATAAASGDGAAADEQRREVEGQRKCEACHAFVDSFYMQLQSVFHQRKKTKANNRVVEIPSDQMMFKVCDEMDTVNNVLYGKPVVKLCKALLTEYRQQLIETFSSKFEVSDTTENFYMLKRRLCEFVQPGCMPAPPTEISTCDACRMLMDDIQRVTSWGVGRKNFGAKDHLWRVLDDICLTLSVRYPLHGRDTVLETCTDMMDEYSNAIVEALAGAIQRKVDNPSLHVCQKVTHLCDSDEL